MGVLNKTGLNVNLMDNGLLSFTCGNAFYTLFLFSKGAVLMPVFWVKRAWHNINEGWKSPIPAVISD